MKRWLLTVVTLLLLAPLPSSAQEEKPKWPGVDEAVVEKFAKELGRGPREPFFNTDQGDLLLFLFTLAGSVGGFVVGFYWHKVFIAGKEGPKEKD